MTTSANRFWYARRMERFLCVKHSTGMDAELTYILVQETLPFALVGSNNTYQVAGSAIRGRMYPWGIVEGRRKRIRAWMVTRW